MLSKTPSGHGKAVLLTWRMQLIFGALTLVPLLVVGLVTVHEFRSAYQVRVTDHLSALVQKHSKVIDDFLAARRGNIRGVARSCTIGELSSEPFLRDQLTLLQEEYGGVFVDLGLIDPAGVQRAYSGPFNLSQANYSGTRWFSEAKKADDYISDVFTGLRGTRHFIVAVTKPYGGQKWMVRATIDFKVFCERVANIRLGGTGFAFVLNRAGEFQTKQPQDVIVDRGPYAEFLKAQQVPERVYVQQRTDALGQEALFAVATLNGGRWLLCYQQDAADAFAKLNLAIRHLVYWLVACGALVNVIAFFFIRRAARRLAAADTEKEIMRNEVVEAGRLASIGELAAGIAHEINNPVAIMVEEAGWIQDILGDEDPTSDENIAEITRAAGQIRTQGGRCKEITHKLLSFARKTDSNVREVQLNGLIKEVVGVLGQRTRYANIEVVTKLAPDMPPVAASATELQQVLLNLVNNASDAMEKTSGGTLTISTGIDDDHLILTVSDTGVGIPKANLPRIFDPFYTTKAVGQGTGLGLSICYGIIKKMGGDIRVESAKGQGTAFIIRLPASSAGESSKADAEQAEDDADSEPQSFRE